MAKIAIKSVDCYEVFIGGKSQGIFRVASHWQGMDALVSLSDPANTLVVDSGSTVGVLADLFKEPREVQAIKASPDILLTIKEASKKQDAT